MSRSKILLFLVALLVAGGVLFATGWWTTTAGVAAARAGCGTACLAGAASSLDGYRTRKHQGSCGTGDH